MVMVKTSVYLPDELKDRLAQAAELSGDSEATIIRSALEHWLASMLRPRSKMIGSLDFGDPDFAEKVDEYLAGFGES
jgi:Ribbon-helix-helix protein, copG family